MGAISGYLGFASHWSIDWIVFCIIAAIFAVDAYRSGASRAATVSLALTLAYVAHALLSKADVLSSFMGQFSAPMPQAVLFLALCAASYFAVDRVGLSHGADFGSPVSAILTGLAASALVCAFWFMVPDLSTLWEFGNQFSAIFGQQFGFFWIVGSFAVLAYVRS